MCRERQFSLEKGEDRPMKKQFISTVFLFFIPFILLGGEVEKKAVWTVAQNFVSKRNYIAMRYLSKPVILSIANIEPFRAENSAETLGYIAELEPKGFLVISGNTDLDPVIAYSFRYDWNPDTSQGNVFYQILKYDLKQRIEMIDQLSNDAKAARNDAWKDLMDDDLAQISSYSFRQWPPEGTTSTGGWVETTWHQGWPYNNFCPIDPSTANRSIVGCVATSLAQVINYHQSIGNLRFDSNDSYTTLTRKIKIDSDSALYDFPSFQRLNGYLAELKWKYQNNRTLANQDLAALNFSCGIVVQMDYTSSSSAAKADSLASILKNRFGYHLADFKGNLVNEKSTSDFYYALQENMMNGLPALLQIGVTAFYRLHAIVCDGYNTDGFYHLNFGWGSGSPDDIQDAWYLLPNGMPAEYQFVLSATININPDPNYQKEITSDRDIVYLDGCVVGDTSRYNSFVLQNNGKTTIAIHYIVSSTHFLISRTTSSFRDSLGPAILEPGKSMTIYVVCNPDSIGAFHGQAIVHTTAMNPYLNIHLFGFGAPTGGTIISHGEVEGVWDKAHSPYYICGDIAIRSGSKLRIRSGTEVIFLDRFKLTTGVNAQLIAKGALSDSIRFHPSNSVVGWSGLVFQQTSNDDTLSYCVISGGKGNHLDFDYGGAVFIYCSSPTIMNSRLVDNQAEFGGAIYCKSGDPSIKFTTIENNYASEHGGAIRLKQSSPLIENSLFYQNSAGTNSAFLSTLNSSPTFVNVTVADNIDGQYLGGFMYLDSANYVTFRNSILWTSEKENLEIHMVEENTLEFEYSDIKTTYLYKTWPIIGYPYQKNKIIWGPGDIATDPLFTHSDSLKYILKKQSPCIDAGHPGSEYYDPEDPARPGFALWPAMGTIRNDMGAYGGKSQQFVVPVELAFFQAFVEDNDVSLIWVTLSESNNFGFEIERCSDDHDFSRIAFIQGHGTTAEPHRYSYCDENLDAGEYVYRLKQIDHTGMYRYSEPLKVHVTVPLSFSLSQNYPNPFNALTTIKYSVPYESKIAIVIYNTQGAQVKALVHDVVKPGVYQVIWDGTNDLGGAVSNGCYFVKMKAKDFQCMKKLLIIK